MPFGLVCLFNRVDIFFLHTFIFLQMYCGFLNEGKLFRLWFIFFSDFILYNNQLGICICYFLGSFPYIRQRVSITYTIFSCRLVRKTFFFTKKMYSSQKIKFHRLCSCSLFFSGGVFIYGRHSKGFSMTFHHLVLEVLAHLMREACQVFFLIKLLNVISYEPSV